MNETKQPPDVTVLIRGHTIVRFFFLAFHSLIRIGVYAYITNTKTSHMHITVNDVSETTQNTLKIKLNRFSELEQFMGSKEAKGNDNESL